MDARNDNTGRDAGAEYPGATGDDLPHDLDLQPHEPPDDRFAEGEDEPEGYDPADDWDAHDERRQKDQFAPPQEPCECYCLHCGRVFMSDAIWFQRVVNSRDGFEGFWMCPTPNCGGSGFTFDIFPTDPDHPANADWTYCDDEEEDAEGEEAGEAHEWDPDEPEYKALDESHADEPDDDLEGEEWKYGLEPGERPDQRAHWPESARREWEEEQRKYDQPDERPRELDWSNRDDREPGNGGRDRDRDQFNDDDIPF